MWRRTKTAFLAIVFSIISLHLVMAASTYNSYTPGATPPGCDADILAGILGTQGGQAPNGEGSIGSTGEAPGSVPGNIQEILLQAMAQLSVPNDQLGDLEWIVQHESSGKCGATNSKSTAVGLFQMLKMNYYLFPRGAASIGNCVEEAEGGIKYILGRYHSAGRARIFWESHHWY
jgi:hypothetical protein